MRMSPALGIALLLMGAVACGQQEEPPVEVFDDIGIDGAPCSSDSDCDDGICLDGPRWPEGHCTTEECTSDDECGVAGFPAQCRSVDDDGNICVRQCHRSDPDSCREGYECARSDDGNYCRAEQGLGIRCESVTYGTVAFDFEIAESTTSFLVVPYAAGHEIHPRSLTLPDDRLIDLSENDYMNFNSTRHSGLNPTLIPMAPKFEHLLQSGQYTYRVKTEAPALCYYVLENSSLATIIDLNLYFVGLSDLDAESAPSHGNLGVVLDELDSLLKNGGSALGEVRYFDVSDEVADYFRVLHSMEDLEALLTHSEPPGETTNELLSLNVFIPQRIAFDDGSNLLGFSAGIPGPAGVHSKKNSGVVVSGEYIGGSGLGNSYTSIIMAHEIGHYLGLFHTTEYSGRTDPLEDTPECSNLGVPHNCPDWGNVMFPMMDSGNQWFSEDQGAVIRANPLTN